MRMGRTSIAAVTARAVRIGRTPTITCRTTPVEQSTIDTVYRRLIVSEANYVRNTDDDLVYPACEERGPTRKPLAPCEKELTIPRQSSKDETCGGKYLAKASTAVL